MNILLTNLLFISTNLFVDYGNCTAAVHQIPMQKTHNTKNLFGSTRQNALLRETSYNVTVFGYDDMEYIVNISLGTPPQEFSVLLDTGSGTSWVVDSKCGNTGCFAGCAQEGTNYCSQLCDAKCCGQNAKFEIDTTPKSCQNFTKFKSHASSTYRNTNEPFSITYGVGFAAGSIGVDVLKFGSASDLTALTLPSAQFGQADQKDTQKGDFSGILGLTYTDDNPNVDPVVVQAHKKGVIEKAMFSIYLITTGGGGTVSGKAGGVFTLGGTDKENCGEIVDWIGIIPNNVGHWKFKIDQIHLDNDTTIKAEHSEGIVDTGSSHLVGPWDQVLKIYEHYGIHSLYDPSIPCDQNIGPLVFLINGHKYEVTKDTLILRKSANKCVLALSGIGENFWVLGDPFCRQFCQVHDIEKRRVAFPEAKKKHQNE